MRIVLLGATGFVGKHLLAELSGRGHHCIVPCRHISSCGELKLIPAVELVQTADLSAENLSRILPRADAVINLVGILNESGSNGLGFRKAHVGVVENLIEACRSSGVRRVVQMSALNAGQGKSHYLISKGKAEDLLRSTDFIDATMIQPSVIFGAGDSFFNRFAGLLKLTPVLPLACPNSLMQPVWVGDVVHAIGETLQTPETIGRSLELAGPKVYSLRDLVVWTARARGLHRWIIGLSDPLSRIQAWLMDFVPGKPFSNDNYKSLQVDSVSHNNALVELGIRPSSIDAVVKSYLGLTPHQQRLDQWRQRPGAE
jgi:uncharacterized protein YbjT (DUF2867 family)